MDDLGSPVRFGDEVMGYDEFGNNLHQHTSSQPFSYTGYQGDPTSNNLYAQARQYDLTTGRFVSRDTHWHTDNMVYGDINTYSDVPKPLHGIVPDTLAIGQSSNLYSYTMNNPLNYLDLIGEAFMTITAAVVWGSVKVFAGGAAIGAATNVVTQVSSDMIAGESFNDSFDNISWGEV